MIAHTHVVMQISFVYLIVGMFGVVTPLSRIGSDIIRLLAVRGARTFGIVAANGEDALYFAEYLACDCKWCECCSSSC
jgi:hypothetical protein